MARVRNPHDRRDGFQDGLVPLEPLDVASCETVDDLVRAMAKTAFGGRSVGDAADVLEAMVRDPDCGVVVTVTGAMTVAKQSLLLCEMIDRGWADVVVTTGALVTHGCVEGIGAKHFRYDPSKHSDKDLYAAGYDRVYDSLELEKNIDRVGRLTDAALASFGPEEPFGSAMLHRRIGEMAIERHPGQRGLLQSAAQHDVPVFVPAFTDSELGLTVGVWARYCRAQDKVPPRFDPLLDLDGFAEWAGTQKKMGILSIGGGVPRNWAQQVGPYTEWMATMGIPLDPAPAKRECRYSYAVRVCPEPVYLGGLSGSTYSEGQSWGKFFPGSEGGRVAEVFADATIVWPLLVRALIERIG